MAQAAHWPTTTSLKASRCVCCNVHACCTTVVCADGRDAVLHAHLPDPKGYSPSGRSASHQIRKGQAPAGDRILYRSVRPMPMPFLFLPSMS